MLPLLWHLSLPPHREGNAVDLPQNAGGVKFQKNLRGASPFRFLRRSPYVIRIACFLSIIVSVSPSESATGRTGNCSTMMVGSSLGCFAFSRVWKKPYPLITNFSFISQQYIIVVPAMLLFLTFCPSMPTVPRGFLYNLVWSLASSISSTVAKHCSGWA